ncbi:coproporphyrinogen III oxidase [Adlercreutzia sp. R21]|uniref:coproporphyrinogen III oxidase n=1 Tax=Adlercreutzia wanghongyangiae TaxID=3111451 RepID=UPI002DBA2BE5|nr:coproporphyrinogen III oxidase [Adlercreutzia sp. R21]MEC4184141.1 coproporphyrinogen III oxidase [Adlercreutzia sp. R21]
MTERRDAIVAIEVPLALNGDALERPGMQLGWNSERSRRYAAALVAEIEANAGQFDDCMVRAVALGGGVATMLGRDMATVMAALRRSCPVADDAFVSATAAVANISGATFPFFRRAGVNRFDFEMMSLVPANFTRLNQTDNLADFPVVCDHFLHAYANKSLGVVLAFGAAGKDADEQVTTMRRSALAAARTHTAHVRLAPVGPALAADGVACEDQRRAMADALEGHGLAEYLPGLFARPGAEDRFALMDAAGCPRIGFGAGALTRIDGATSRNTADFERYCVHAADYVLITEQVGAAD